MQRKRHAVAHLPGLGNRRENFGGSDIDRKAVIPGVVLEQRQGLIERGGSGIDQRQHRDEGRVASPGAVGRRSKIEQPEVAGVDHADLFVTPGPECRKLHERLPLFAKGSRIALAQR
jgi:hypothetical protein